MDEMRMTPYGSIMKGPPQMNTIKIVKDTVAMKMGGLVHKMPDGSMMLNSAMKKGGKVKKPAKGSKAMKDKMAKLRAMKK